MTRRAWDGVTLAVFAACAALWVVALALPPGWVGLQVGLLVFTLTLHSSLTHEILHGLALRRDGAATALGVFQPGLAVPYLRFKALHLAHHRDSDLTDPYDDPESNYLDPARWAALPEWARAVLTFNNTLAGRMLIGPLVGTLAFWRDDWRRVRGGERAVAVHWLAHLPGVALTLVIVAWSSVPMWAYLVACYGALSVLRIRTFLEHQAHEKSGGRSVIIEDGGLLSFLFLNNNYHVVHHMHPSVAWYALPALYRARKARFLAANRGYVYRSYREVFGRFFVACKDPVAHPLWTPEAGASGPRRGDAR